MAHICMQKVNYFAMLLVMKEFNVHLTVMNDQERISPYNINVISNRQVMRIKKNIYWGIIS